MDFFEALNTRRSVRVYTNDPVPDAVMEAAIQAALKAPNSSNMQCWQFYWLQSEESKKRMIEFCLNQSTVKTAQSLLVVVADTRYWLRNSLELAAILRKNKAPEKVIKYYEKLMPIFYGFRFFAPLKFLAFNLIGLFRPITRGPYSSRGIMEVAIKSAALASENFMLAIRAQDFDTCPMEGIDECRIKKYLGLGLNTRVVMVISVGKRAPDGIWGEQIRLNPEWFVKKI